MAEVSLLDFPSPPTHIPNPPPSLPPAQPLPPVPGPSPISDNFLRRSIASYRDSIAAAPLSDLDDDPAPSRKSHHYNESISDIQLPLSDPDDEDDHTATLGDPIDPMTLHLQIRASRSRSASHKQFLRARSVSPSRARSVSKSPVPPLPPSPRPPSPDVPALLSITPRPHRHRSALPFDVLHADHHPLPRRVSDGDIAIERARTRPFNLDHAVAFPSMLSHGAEIEAILERQLDGADSDSDSSIDLHTPLPRLMVRDGLLSPHSKLLPQPGHPFSPQVRSSVYSIVSTTSNMTKSGIMKDTRDTPMRRHRHRDGRLLRGGIGLTTGLGWSDSEDEDAPSPLTRRLSSLSLMRRSSALSVRSTPVYSLSRSFSGSSVIEESEGRDDYDGPVRQRSNTLTSNSRQATKLPHPPTSWQRRTHTSSHPSSGSSKDSLQLSIPELPEHGNQRSTSEYDSANTPSSASSLSIPTPSTPADDLPKRRPTGILDKNKCLPPLPTGLRKPSSNMSLVSGTRTRTISSTSSIHSMSNSPPSIPLPPVPALNGSSTPRPLKLPDAYRRQSQPQTPTFRGGGLDRPAVPVPGVLYFNSSLRPLGTSTSNPALSVSTTSRSLPRPVSRLPCKSPTAPTSPSGDALSFPLSTLTSANLNKQKPRPRIGSGMIYRTSSSIDSAVAGASKRGAPKSLTLASNGHPPSAPRSVSTSLPITRPGTLRTPSGMPRAIFS
ncbi:hypothetical protein APHAL10511_007180 [Amanita phalloides]|nr:hypothetical protein APHAL10511_007180 [Amanita phalloides]